VLNAIVSIQLIAQEQTLDARFSETYSLHESTEIRSIDHKFLIVS
jgi:hypothetical protein